MENVKENGYLCNKNKETHQRHDRARRNKRDIRNNQDSGNANQRYKQGHTTGRTVHEGSFGRSTSSL